MTNNRENFLRKPLLKDRAHDSVIHIPEVSFRAGMRTPHLVIPWTPTGWEPAEDEAYPEVVLSLALGSGVKPTRDHILNKYRLNAILVSAGFPALPVSQVQSMTRSKDWGFLSGSRLFLTTVERPGRNNTGYSHTIVASSIKGGIPYNLEVTAEEATAVKFS